MHTAEQEDLTSRAVIRDCALALFADRGFDAVSVKRIAEAAGVSPALVIHYGSKQGLRDVIDAHVVRVLEGLWAGVEADPASMAGGAGRVSGTFSELVATHLPPGSWVPAYVRRLLVRGGEPGRTVFRRLFDASAALLEQLTGAGVMRPSADPAVRAAFLLINDLALVLLREQLTGTLGVDPLSPEGMRRWADGVSDAYTHGVFETGER